MHKKIKSENIYKYFFYLFLFFLPFQARKVFLTDYSFYSGGFTEYGSVFLYWSDVLLLGSFISLTIFSPDIIKNGLNSLKDRSREGKVKNILVALSVLVVWFFISTFVNREYTGIGVFRSMKILEILCLIFFIFLNFKKKSFFISSLFVVALSGFFQGILAIFQFLFQKNLFSSPFLHKITGETILSVSLPGIAKISDGGEKLIRAYGTFPHPNLLGGFLVFSLMISLYLYLEHKDSLLSSKVSFFGITAEKYHKYCLSIFWILLVIVQSLSLFFSFSRSAWVGFCIAILSFLILNLKRTINVSRETFICCLFKYKEMVFCLFLIFVFIFNNYSLLLNRVFQDVTVADKVSNDILQNNTFGDRVFYNNVSRETLSANPIFGSGPGTAIFQINKYIEKLGGGIVLESWQYQPSHNIYLLSMSETGIVGFLVFVFVILLSIRIAIIDIVSRETLSSYKIFKITALSILAGFIFIGFFDHYFWTLQQGQIIFWIIIGLLILKSNVSRETLD